MKLDDNEEYQKPPFHINIIGIPNDNLVKLSYEVFKPSVESRHLKSEHNRTLFAEEFSDSAAIKSLQVMNLKLLAKTYRGGSIPRYIEGNSQLRKMFFELIPVNLSLKQCINIDEREVFWRRVFVEQCPDKMLVHKKQHTFPINWKSMALGLKFQNIIESSTVELWNDEKMFQLAKMCKNFITEMHIRKLQPLKEYSFKYNKEPTIESESESESEFDYQSGIEREKEIKVGLHEKRIEYEYPAKDCHHVYLTFLGVFQNVTTLTIEFSPPELGTKYHSRFFKFSYDDIKGLAE